MIIDILFACINTAVLLAIFYYIYNRFLKARIQQGIILEQSMHMNSVKRQESLRKQEQSLVRAYYHQHYRYEELSHKIQKWRQHIDATLQEKLHESERLAQSIEHSRQEREAAVQERALCAAVVQGTIAESHKDLTIYFQDTASSRHYLERIVIARSRRDSA